MAFNLFNQSSTPSEQFGNSLRTGNFSITNPQGQVVSPMPNQQPAVPRNVPGQYVRTQNNDDAFKVSELANALRQDNPKLKSVTDDNELVQAVVADNPHLSSIFEPQQPKMGFMDTVGAFGSGIGQGIVQGGANLLKTASDIGSYINPERYYNPDFQAQQDQAKDIVQSIPDFTYEYGAQGKGSTASKVGQAVGETGVALATPGGVLGQGFKEASLGGKILRGATQGVIDTAKYTGASEARLPTAGEAVVGGVVGGLFPAISGAIDKTKSMLQLSGNLNPAKLTQVKDMLIKEGEDGAASLMSSFEKRPEDVAQFMLDRGITGTKEQMIEKLVKLADTSKNHVDEVIASIPGTFKNTNVTTALKELKTSLNGVSGMEGELKAVNDLLKKSQSKAGLTLAEINEVKRKMDRTLNLFTIAGDVKSGNVKQGLANLRSSIRGFIEKTAENAGQPGIRAMNNVTAVSNKLAEAIGKKESADIVRQIISPFSGGTIGALSNTGPFDSNTPEGKIGNFIVGAIGGSLANSSLVKTKLASILNSISPSESALINSYIESRGAGEIPEKLMDIFSKLKYVTK